MALSKEDILNAIAEMTVMDVVDLIAAMEAGNGRIEIEGKDPNGSPRSYSFYRY